MAPPAATICSKLSSTSSVLRPRRCSTSRSSGGSFPTSTPSATVIADGTRFGSATASSAMKKTPSGNVSSSSAASCSARRVLPVPPGPVRVRRRVLARRRRAPSISSRPTNVVGWTGRLFGLPSRVRKLGKDAGRPGTTAWNRRSGRVRSFSRCSPRSRSSTPSGSDDAASARAASDTRIWPPCPAAVMRATWWRVRPT